MATLESDIRGLSTDEIASGVVPLATLRVSPEELKTRVGIDWATDSDELGDFRSSVFETGPDHARFALLSYEASDPPEITLLGKPASADVLGEVLRSLRIAESEVFDRVDWATEAPVTEAMSARGSLTGLEQSLRSLQAQVEKLQTEREISRLASLASIEDVDLTPRQREVLQLMVSGLSAREVADQLHLSTSTVHRHLRAVRNVLVHPR